VSQARALERASTEEGDRAFGFPWMVVTKPDGESANFFGSEYVHLLRLSEPH
jgi:hypothetical protein